MLNVLITGGNGYVGRVLTRQIMNEHNVCVVDNERYGELRFTQDDLSHFKFINADIRNRDKMTEVIENFSPDVIIHLAAVHYIPECESSPEFAVSTNIEGTINILSLCPKSCRFVFASSGAVYAPQETAHDEVESPTQPMDVYGFTKLHCEDYIRYFSQIRGFSSVIVRLFNVVGSGETNPHLLPEIFAQFQAGYKVLKLGNITPKRDYIDVRDAARGFWAVSSCGDIPLGTVTTVNLGTMNQYSVSEILDKIREIGNLDFEIQQDPQRIREVDRPFLLANNHRIKELFGWAPIFNINDSIQDLIQAPDLPQSLVNKYQLK